MSQGLLASGGGRVRYRKKPVEIEAVQWTGGNLEEIEEFAGNSLAYIEQHVIIKTLEGCMRASKGDYIIKGIAGEFYPCKPDIFKATYEEVKE